MMKRIAGVDSRIFRKYPLTMVGLSGVTTFTATGLMPFVFLLGLARSEPGQTAAPQPTKRILTDVTDEVGLDFRHDPGVEGNYFMPESAGSGCAFLDYDSDGDLDIYLVNGARQSSEERDQSPLRNRLFRQEADGRFVDVTLASGLGDPGWGMGVAVGDMDNDGHLDVYVTNYGPDALYRNDGDGTFHQITRRAGIDNPNWASSALFFDYDRDGFLDLYVVNYVRNDPGLVCMGPGGLRDYCAPENFPGLPDQLYHNQGNGTFAEVSATSGITEIHARGLGVVSADFNGDDYLDLYVANDRQANHLFINQNDGTFRNRALLLGAGLNELGRPEASMGIALGDADDDGDWDLVLTHLRWETNTFYTNAGTYGFWDETSRAGLSGPSLAYTGWGTGFFDYDHDGDLDLAWVNGRVGRGPRLVEHNARDYWDDYAEPNALFENQGRRRFRDVSSQAGTFCSDIENSRGLAFGDVDNDGDLDLLLSNTGGRARLLRNEAVKKGHWLMLRALDPSLRRDALGARITITAAGKQLHRLVAPAYSYLSSSDPRAHFGLGGASKVEQIVVIWPDGRRESFPGAAADQILTLKKGEGRDAPAREEDPTAQPRLGGAARPD